MRRIIIDTDTASDDAVALILALREPKVKVEAITVVAGNVPLNLAVKNALVSIEVANTYRPPVFKGASKPLLRDLFTSEFVHGEGGMGNMNLMLPQITVESVHAVDGLINLIECNPVGLELITLGPLTNIAIACLKSPETVKRLDRITIMGGAGFGSGNITPVAEYNVYADAEAMSIVLNVGVPILLVGWDVSLGEAFIYEQDIRYMLNSGSKIAEFCVQCNQSLWDFNRKRMNKDGIDLPDPVAVASALYPDIIIEALDAFTSVEYKSEATYGQVIIDYMDILKKKPNAKICKSIDGNMFKKHLYDAIL